MRKVRGEADLERIFAPDLWLAVTVREQRQHQRGRKIYSLHAPEVECIGKGKAHRPYEFGVKSRSPRRFIARRAASSSPM